MTNPLEGGASFDSAPANQEERVAQLRGILEESSGAVIDSLLAELDLAVEQLRGKELERKLDEIESDLMSDDFSGLGESGV